MKELLQSRYTHNTNSSARDPGRTVFQQNYLVKLSLVIAWKADQVPTRLEGMLLVYENILQEILSFWLFPLWLGR